MAETRWHIIIIIMVIIIMIEYAEYTTAWYVTLPVECILRFLCDFPPPSSSLSFAIIDMIINSITIA